MEISKRGRPKYMIENKLHVPINHTGENDEHIK